MNEDQLPLRFADESEIPNPDGPRADLPIIQLPSAGFTITESADALFRLIAASHKLFVRDRTVMKLGQNQNRIDVLSVLDADEARSEFEKFGQLVIKTRIKGKDVPKPSLCSAATAQGLLSSAEARQLLPKVNGLINCPVIYEFEGRIAVAGPGYDARLKRLITGGTTPEQVCLEDAKKALLGLLNDFDFQSAGDKSRAIASFIAPALKLGGFLKCSVPADVAEADQSQAGKGYRQKLVAAIYNESLSVVANRQGGVGSLDESFSYQLLEGRPFIQFDNLRGKLDSQMLESFFTADGIVPCRIPYQPIVSIRAGDYFIFLTSNGVETTRDLANRSAIIRIRKRPPEYTFQKYEEGDLLAHVRAKQPFYLGCVFAVIRAWHEAGKQISNEVRHDFKEWVQVMDWIVQTLLCLSPMMEGHQQAQLSVSNPDLVFLRAVAIAIAIEQHKDLDEASEEWLSSTEIVGICLADGIEIPGLRAGANADAMARQVGVCLGRLFRENAYVELEGYRIERLVIRIERPDGKGHYPAKQYAFRRVTEKNSSPSTRSCKTTIK